MTLGWCLVSKQNQTIPRGRISLGTKAEKEERRAKKARQEAEYEPGELPNGGDGVINPEQHLNLLTELGVNFSKLGYKPRPAYCAKGATPYYAIQQLASLGLTQRQVHLTLGWGEGVWNKRKAEDPRIMEEYEMGFSRGLTMIVNRHFTAAMQGSIPAMQFIMKTKGGFSEPKEEKIGPQELAAAIKMFMEGVNETTGSSAMDLPAPEDVPTDGE